MQCEPDPEDPDEPVLQSTVGGSEDHVAALLRRTSPSAQLARLELESRDFLQHHSPEFSPMALHACR